MSYTLYSEKDFKRLIRLSMLLKRLAGEVSEIGDHFNNATGKVADILHSQAIALNDASHAIFKGAYKMKGGDNEEKSPS